MSGFFLRCERQVLAHSGADPMRWHVRTRRKETSERQTGGRVLTLTGHGRPTHEVGRVRPVGHQAPGFHELRGGGDRRQMGALCEFDEKSQVRVVSPLFDHLVGAQQN
jgi:hypothetical protein